MTVRSDKDDSSLNPDTKPLPPKRSKKKAVLSTVFLLVICAVSIYIMLLLGDTLSGGNAKSLRDTLAEMDLKYFALALCVLLAMLILDATKFYLIAGVCVGRPKLLASIKVSLLGKYYDNITPFSTGGQPFQIYYLSKKGYSGGQASAITLIKYFAQMFAWLVVSALLMSLCNNCLDKLEVGLATTLRVGAWIGFAFNALLPLSIICFTLLPKLADGMARGIAGIGYKLKLVKDRDALLNKAHKVVEDFKQCCSIMTKSPLKTAVLILICFVEPVVTLSFPFFLVVAFAHLPPALTLMLQIMALNIFASYAVAIIPTPGNSGFVETTFTLAFSTIAADVLFGVTLTWRFFTYYIYIVIGLGISVFELIRNLMRAKKQRTEEGK